MKHHGSWVQHVANPLHVYCRLIDFGMSTRFSRRLSIIYEKYVFQVLTKDLKQAWISPRKKSW